jgi:hypothetical protein
MVVIRGPSIKTMREAWPESQYGITATQIKALKDCMTGERSSKSLCDELGINRTYLLERFQRILAIADKFMNCHGVEYIKSSTDTMHASEGLEYVNTGDTYRATLIYDCLSECFYAKCWGDIVEKDQRFKES